MADNDVTGGDRGQAAAGGGCSSSSQNVPQEIVYRGVYKSGHKFIANVVSTPLPKYVGSYSTPEEAAKAYDEAALERVGDQAILNFLPDGRLNPSRLTLPPSPAKTSTFKGQHLSLRPRLIWFYIKRHFHEEERPVRWRNLVKVKSGVSADQKRWRASYGSAKAKAHRLGSYASEEDAARAYDEYAKRQDKNAILNFLPDGSLNPHRHQSRSRRRWFWAVAAPQSEGSVGIAALDSEQQEAGEDDEEDEEKTEEAEARPHKMRRLNEDRIIDLTHDEPMQAIASSASRASTRPPTPVSVRAMMSTGGGRASAQSAAFNGRRTMPMTVTGGGVADDPSQPAPTAPRAAVTPPSASASRVKEEAAPAIVPTPAPQPTASVKVEASAAVPSSSSTLKMTLLQATALLSAEAFKRLATCEEGSEETASLERLMNMLQQLLREARSAHASSSSSSASSGSTADLRAFLLTFVCPKYTAEELKGSQLDNVLQMGLCAVKL